MEGNNDTQSFHLRPILLVDDNQAHRQLIKRAIMRSKIDHPVLEVSSVKMARDLLHDLSLGTPSPPLPTLAIIDLQLGDGRGTNVVSDLRSACAALSAIPILVLSTSNLETDMQESYRLGADCYLTKQEDTLLFTRDISKSLLFLLSWAERNFAEA